MPGLPRLLLVEDTPSLSRLYMEYLKREPVELHLAETGAEARAKIASLNPQLILLDLMLPDADGMEILKDVRDEGRDAAVIVATANGSVNKAVEAMQLGAADFLVKPIAPERLLVTIRNAIKTVALQKVVAAVQGDAPRNRYHGFIGASLAMQAVYRVIDAAAASKATVFITGESGTGKEVAAEAIHKQSPRRDGPFVPLNCGAIPRELMESELFGHVKGAFTGAVSDHAGAALRADGGTLFLDEIGEMDLNLQVKLLRFLQTGTVQRVGSSKLEKVDLRIVCATNRDPLKEVEAGRFREDLYYRLHVIPLHLPPLREREDDVLLIARALLKQYADEENRRFTGFAPDVEAIVATHPWPGNVRQLQNVLRNIVVLHDAVLVERSMLPPPLNAVTPVERTPEPVVAGVRPVNAGIVPLWQVERDAIESAIAQCEGNIPKAAALLEVSPSTLYRKRLGWAAEGKLAG